MSTMGTCFICNDYSNALRNSRCSPCQREEYFAKKYGKKVDKRPPQPAPPISLRPDYMVNCQITQFDFHELGRAFPVRVYNQRYNDLLRVLNFRVKSNDLMDLLIIPGIRVVDYND